MSKKKEQPNSSRDPTGSSTSQKKKRRVIRREINKKGIFMKLSQDEIRGLVKGKTILPRIVQVDFFYRLFFDVHPYNYCEVDIPNEKVADHLNMPVSELRKYRRQLIRMGRLQMTERRGGRHGNMIVKAVKIEKRDRLPDHKTITDAQGDLERTLMQMAQENNRQKEEAA